MGQWPFLVTGWGRGRLREGQRKGKDKMVSHETSDEKHTGSTEWLRAVLDGKGPQAPVFDCLVPS